MVSYRARCQQAYEKLAASRGVEKTFRVAVMQADGGCFSKDFHSWSDAASMYRANILYGSPILVAAFKWTEKLGWSEFIRHPDN